MVERLGYEPVFATGRGESLPADEIDVLLVEPADSAALATAERALRRRRTIPVVCVSIDPALDGVELLRPLAYLVKPFGLAELGHALRAAAESTATPVELAS